MSDRTTSYTPDDEDDDQDFNPLAPELRDPTPTPPTAPVSTPAPTAPAPVAATTPTAVPPTPSASVPAEVPPTPTVPAEAAPGTAEAGTVDDDEIERRRRRDAEIARYARRRHLYLALLVAAVLLVCYWVKPWTTITGLSATPANPTATTSPMPRTATQAATVENSAIENDMKAVHAKYDADHDLTGLTITDAQVAAAGKTAYVARTLDGVCTVYGVLNGADIIPVADTSNGACTTQMAQVQAQLDEADANARQGEVDTVEGYLTDSVAAVKFYAQHNFNAGQPSLNGLESSMLEHVTVSKNHSQYATLTARKGDTCRTVIVTSDGDLGEVSAC